MEDATNAPPLPAGMTARVKIDAEFEGDLEVSLRRVLAGNLYRQ